MEFLQSIYQSLYHTSPITPSKLDMILFAIRSFISFIGTFVIFVGVMIGAYRFILFRFFPHKITQKELLGIDFIRRDLGRTIVLGLEFIIAADVVGTTTTPDYYSLGILAIIVVIRTFLSYSLTREIAQLTPAQKYKLQG